MCQISTAISYAESIGQKDKVVELKVRCKSEFGLEVDDDKMKMIEQFTKWMRDGKAKFKNFRMKYYGPDYRGIHTYERIEPNDVFLKVPYELIITPQSGRETSIGKKIEKTKVKVHWDYLVYITIFLMTEMHNPKSKWKPYMDVYPKLANVFPIFYTEEEKSLLCGTPMLDQIASEYKMLSDEYDRLLGAIPEFKEFTKEEYIRNKILVVSRIFYVKLHGKEERIMVPLAGSLVTKM